MKTAGQPPWFRLTSASGFRSTDIDPAASTATCPTDVRLIAELDGIDRLARGHSHSIVVLAPNRRIGTVRAAIRFPVALNQSNLPTCACRLAAPRARIKAPKPNTAPVPWPKIPAMPPFIQAIGHFLPLCPLKPLYGIRKMRDSVLQHHESQQNACSEHYPIASPPCRLMLERT